MLDIYLSENRDEIPETPVESLLVGSLSLEEHQCIGAVLSQEKNHGIKFPFFEDSLLSYDQVLRLRSLIGDHVKNGKAISDFSRASCLKAVDILSSALKKGCGVISYCD